MALRPARAGEALGSRFIPRRGSPVKARGPAAGRRGRQGAAPAQAPPGSPEKATVTFSSRAMNWQASR